LRPAAACRRAASAEKSDQHPGVQDADERHRKNEGEGEERSVEDSTVARVGQNTSVEAGRANFRVLDRIAISLRAPHFNLVVSLRIARA